MTTFSQLVDKMVSESKRPDLLVEVVSYVNLTLRECHFEPDRNNVVFYRSNYREAALVSNLEQGFYWQIPNVALFQGIQAVRYGSQFIDGYPAYAEEVTPGRFAARKRFTYMVTGDRVFFGGEVGYGGLNAQIQIAYFEYPRSLKYYPPATRPATFDLDSGWTYHADYDLNEETRQVARDMVSNWLLQRWDMVVEEGVRAKIFKRNSDEVRQRTSYSMFKQLQRGLFTSEVAVL